MSASNRPLPPPAEHAEELYNEDDGDDVVDEPDVAPTAHVPTAHDRYVHEQSNRQYQELLAGADEEEEEAEQQVEDVAEHQDPPVSSSSSAKRKREEDDDDDDSARASARSRHMVGDAEPTNSVVAAPATVAPAPAQVTISTCLANFSSSSSSSSSSSVHRAAQVVINNTHPTFGQVAMLTFNELMDDYKQRFPFENRK